MHRARCAALVAAATCVVVGACSDEADDGASAGAGAAAASSSSGTHVGGEAADGGAGVTSGTGTAGDAPTGPVGSVGSSGTGGKPGCTSDADCAGSPFGEVCDPRTGACLGCLEHEDCPAGTYCAQAYECDPGCIDDAGCTDGLFCHEHQCVECIDDESCFLGTICLLSQCVPGCNVNHPCQAGFSCCGQVCFDLATDPEHCGSCQHSCAPLWHASPLCNGGTCALGACDTGWADCDLDVADGCEHNVFQDGPCICVPGELEPCYTGTPGTEDVGVCKGGMRTCSSNGVIWGPCIGQVLPSPEQCNGLDDDCDGSIEPQPCN
jgi:hypothetical protein